MLVRITAGTGAGSVVDLIPSVAIARIQGKTAEPVAEEREFAVSKTVHKIAAYLRGRHTLGAK